MNQFNGIGRLVREADIKEAKSGKKFARFTIAINRFNDETDSYNSFVKYNTVYEVCFIIKTINCNCKSCKLLTCFSFFNICFSY